METKSKEISKLIANAWANPDLAEELVKSPKDVLRRHGVEYDSDTEVVVLQETTNKKFIVIPQAPNEDLFEEVLESGLVTNDCTCNCRCICCKCQSAPQ